MKPLSEKELREKIRDLVFGYADPSGLNLGETTDEIMLLILAYRKAWGEYVIGKDICTCGCNFGDGCLCLSDAKLRAEQRQRNQGEKTDE